MKRLWNRWLGLGVATTLGFLADWWTKDWVLRNLAPGEIRVVAGDVLQLTLAFNPGSVFGLNPASWIPGFPTSVFYAVVTVVELVVLVVIYRRLDAGRYRLSLWGIALLVPGAAGNFLDRVLGRPGVVDFIRADLGFPPFHPWPIFNVADAWITIGIALLAVDMIRADSRERRERRVAPPIPAGRRPAPPGGRRRSR